jgi:alpha-2-macroglobulin
MQWKPLVIVASLVALSAPLIGRTDSPPQVVFATAGSAGGNSGIIDRFTMRFSEPMVPLGDPRARAPIDMKCTVGGAGRWVDPQTFVHEFVKPLPGGLTCEAKLRDGLASVRGVQAAGTKSFSIDTGGPSARTVLPGTFDGDIEEDQVFLVAANVAPTKASVAGAAYCAVDGIGEAIAVDVLPATVVPKLLSDLGPDNWEVRNFLEEAGLPQNVPVSAADRTAAYAAVTALKCRRPLPPGKDVALVWAGSITSADGRTAGKDKRFDFSVRKSFTARFECSRVNPQAGCNPIKSAYMRFSADIPIAQARGVRLTFADGTSLEPRFSSDDKNNAFVSDLEFKGPLPAGVKATVSMPGTVTDEAGRKLANAARFPLAVAIDQAPPLVKFAAPFGIIEANEGGIMPVTVRAVEPQLLQRVSGVTGDSLRIETSDGQIAKWLRDLDDADNNDFRTTGEGDKAVTVNYTGTKSLLNGKGSALKLSLPGAGKEFEVVGIPLKTPGFYVVELASPALGRALLGRPATRYVAAGALVTNMAVHFKWGREGSLAWVTSLDGGKPVAGADIRVTDSCSGTVLTRGTSDAQGRLLIKGGLPQPETSGSCDKDSTDHPLMVSARLNGDFSFTMTQWIKGIAPYDFDLNYGYSEPDDIIHTVFDRTLLKNGDTVHMKHILRRPSGTGFTFAGAFKGSLTLTHSGSDTSFDIPVSIGNDGIGETSWTAPQGAPQGDYFITITAGERTLSAGQSVRLDEYRLPTMRAAITGPKSALIRPRSVPLDLFVGFLSGGGAPNLPVSVRTAFSASDGSPDGWEEWSFGGRAVVEGTRALNGDGEEDAVPVPLAQTLPATLGKDGSGKTTIDIAQDIQSALRMIVEMDYQDANGETLTTSRSLRILPSAVQVGIKTDGWLMRDNDLRLKLATLDADGKPIRGKSVRVDVYSREVLTARRRLIGGFYAYDNQARITKITSSCTATTDNQGVAACKMAPGVSGEVTVVATASDADGNVARAVTSVWLAGEDEWWFGGDNGDRMDVIPEAKSYKSGDIAKFQVRMPFRAATALVTVEREGVLSSFVTELSGKDPVISVPMPAAYAPDVYVSVMAVRGRVDSTGKWLAETAKYWGLSGKTGEGAAPTALVDLSKPSYRLGIAKVKVGWEGHQLAVSVKTDKPKYSVRETAMVDVDVREPGGKPAATAEIAFAAVDEALLQLSRNDSWNLIDAMMGERPISVLTSTAQMQIVGKRTYGKKAVEAGGGGGGDIASTVRDDFRPVLLWRGRVALDASGHARIPVELSDSLSSFKLVAIASAGADRFGTGQVSVRTAQDLQIFSGLPPLVRTGDIFGASFTLRNTSDKPMTVTAKATITPSIAAGEPLTVTIPAGGAVPVTWNLPAPEGVSKLDWKVIATAQGSKASDQIAVSQDVIPAIPAEVWAATLTRVGSGTPFPIAAPAGTLPGTGFVDIKLSDTLAPPLEGVRRYMSSYPYNCFEQRLSRAVVQGDSAAWGVLASEIPAYMDSDGLLRYFPSDQLRGSEALTAYVLSMTVEAGFAVPDAARAKMIEAMKSVASGKLTRDYPWRGNDRLTRIAAIAALARNGQASPALLASNTLAAADMPTIALADWLVAIDRTKGANTAQRTEAEAMLRRRLVIEGSRLDLADQANAPWWMMTSGDEMALKALIAVLGRPGWGEDGPKMMVGVALRQSRGHWDTTPANAWGTIAARRFAKLFPANAITGTTTVTLESQTVTQNWPQIATSGPLRLKLPSVQAPLLMTQSAGPGPWAMVSVSAAVPLTKPLFAGYKIEKSVSVIAQKTKGQLTRGDVIKVRITVDASAERSWVVVNDPVVPGGTIIGNLGGQSGLLAAAASGGEGVQPAYVERGKDGWRGYYEWVPRGRFVSEYAVRLNGTGTFTLPPTRVEAMYSPDIRAAWPNAPVTVVMP